LLPDLARGKISNRWESAARQYIRHNAIYFNAVREEAQQRQNNQVRWLVDASKDPYRLFWMQHSDRFDVRVIHLTKDPRAFVYSVTKRELPRASRKVLRMTGRWIVENAIMSQLCRSSFDGKHVMHLKYEDLAAHPNDTMDAVFEWLGLSSKQSVRDYRDKTQHAVSGNKMR
jgi:hypothetical protein